MASPEEIFFINRDVREAFIEYLKGVFNVSSDVTKEVIHGFTDFLYKIKHKKASKEIREEIVLSFRIVLGPAIARYTNDDIIGWVSPYPTDEINLLVGWCIHRLENLEVVSNSWDLTPEKIQLLGDTLWSRIVRKLADTESWNLAYRIKTTFDLHVPTTELVKFIASRKRPYEILDRKKLLDQISVAYKFRIDYTLISDWIKSP